jgi:hypothetical protein
MRDKILAQLKLKYPGVNLSKIRLDAIADKLALSITDETTIDARLDELNEVFSFADIARQDDQVRTLTGKKPPVVKPQTPAASVETDPLEGDDTPAWAKTLMLEVKSLKTDKAQTSMQSKMAANAKLKDVPASFFAKRALPEKEEDLEAFVDEVVADFTGFSQDMVNKGFAIQQPPAGGAGGKANDTAVISSIKKWAGEEKAKADASKTA